MIVETKTTQTCNPTSMIVIDNQAITRDLKSIASATDLSGKQTTVSGIRPSTEDQPHCHPVLS